MNLYLIIYQILPKVYLQGMEGSWSFEFSLTDSLTAPWGLTSLKMLVAGFLEWNGCGWRTPPSISLHPKFHQRPLVQLAPTEVVGRHAAQSSILFFQTARRPQAPTPQDYQWPACIQTLTLHCSSSSGRSPQLPRVQSGLCTVYQSALFADICVTFLILCTQNPL